ncbi:MAG: leucine-rich repeat domain-containing protein, partial [bacterium]|nr:leucine-rich repeat domain-containing protein [bacterium]MDY4108403.1 leucine-rich repeat domain-containing protein [Bacilli bacterium]
IAMPKISDVIKNSKESSLETTAKLIASQAEKKYTENQVLDNSSTIKCSDVAKISDADYESCNITFDSKGNAKVTIVGKGKFEGMAVCNANKNNASISSDCSTDAKYFSYVDATVVSNVIVEDTDKCKSYLKNKYGYSDTDTTTFCAGNVLTNGLFINNAVSFGIIPSSNYEDAGLKVETTTGISITGYNIEGGTDVVIPSQIDGKTVVAIAERAFTKRGVIPTLTAYNNDYKVSLLSYNSNNSYVVKPLDLVESEGLGITSLVIPNTVVYIGRNAFRNNELTKVVIPSSVIQMGEYAFADNKLTDVELSDNIVDIENSTFRNNKLTSIILPKNLTNIYEYAFANNQLGKIFVYGNITLFNGDNFADNPDMIIINNSNIANDDSLWKTMLNKCVTIVEGNTIKPDYSAEC